MMRTMKCGMVALVFAAGFGLSAMAAETYTSSNQLSVDQGRGIWGLTYFANCGNYNHGWMMCPKPPLSSGAPMTENTQEAKHNNSDGSVIDNMGFNHIHMAWDYHIQSGTSGCSSCGGGSGGDSNGLPKFELMRIHRYREVSYVSSYGAGVFNQYDTKLSLYTLADGSTLIDLLDPTLKNVQKFVDGPYTHPFNPTDVKDGTYISYRTNSHKSIQLLDVNGVPATNQALAKQAILLTWDGRKFFFQIVSVDGQLVGRLTRVEDRNGYGISLTYKFNPGDNLGGSESKLWQINTIVDTYGQQATFTYSTATVGGRWVVTQVALPNATTVSYTYATDGYLSGVAYPDGTNSTFTRTYDAVANCTALTYFDAGAEGAHRAKTAYLTTNFSNTIDLPDDIIPQSALLIRGLSNGMGELTYMNLPLAADGAWVVWIFEGNKVLKHLNAGTETLYMYNWTLSRPDGGSWTVDSVNATGEWPGDELDFTSWEEPWYKGVPYQRHTVEGETIAYTYNEAGNVASRTYQDATTETYLYNGFQQITQFKDRANRVYQQTFDSRGNMLSKTTGLLMVGTTVTTTPETATWNWSYFPAGNANQYLLQTSTDANGNVTSYVYNGNHFLTSITEPADNAGDPQAVKNFAYDTAGRLGSSTDAVGRTSVFAYDSRSRVSSILYPDTSTDVFAYGTGVNANLLSDKTDRNGNVTHYEYDLAGRQTVEHVAYGTAVEALRTCTYWPGSELRADCVDRGNKTSYAYDYRNHLASTTVRPNTATALTSATEYVYNRLNKTTDPYGRRTHYVYDANVYLKRVVRELVPNGAGTIPSDQASRDTFLNGLARVSTPNAAYMIEDNEHDAAGNMTAMVDGNGNRSTVVFDSRTRVIEQNEAVGTAIAAKTQFQYDAQGNRTLVIKPRQFSESTAFQTKFAYTGRNLLKSKTEAFSKPEAATESYNYYLDMRPKNTTDGRGNIWTKVWKQCCGRLGVVADPSIPDYLGGPNPIRPVTLYEYNYSGDTTHLTRARNVSPFPTCCLDDVPDADTINETTTKYDARHRPIALTVWLTPLGTADENNPPIYGDAGAPAGKVGLTTRWVYDENLTDGVGLDSTYAAYMTGLNLGVGSVGSAVEATDPAGDKTVTIFDGAGRVVKVIDGNGNASKKTYDVMVAGISGAPGNLLETATTDALSHVVKSETDGGSRTLATIDALSKVTTYSFDNNGNRLQWRDPNAVGQTCQFDARNRETQCTDTLAPTPSVTKKGYDYDNNVVTMTDALNHVTTCAFDARERKISCTDRVGGVTQYQFDLNNNLSKIIDAQSGQTVYSYDPRNLLSTETFPDLGARSSVYDGANRLLSHLDQTNVTTSYIYDLANRLTNRNYPDGKNDTFGFDSASRLISAASARYNNTVARTFDTGSRLTSETQTINGVNYVVGYGFDAANRQTTVTYPDGSVVSRAFTNRNQLDTVNYAGSLVANFVYDPGMRKINATFGNGLIETRTHRQDNLNNTIVIPGVTNFTYTWDSNKNKLGEADGIVPPVNSQTFGYDNEDRLTSFNRQNGDSQTWTLSLVGDWNQFNANGVLQTRTHDAVHELKTINGTALAYDLKGNLTQNTTAQQFVWDFENRMTSATSGATTLGAYKYDALGRRVSKVAGATTTVYINDGLQEICEYDNGAAVGSPSRRFVFGYYIDEPLLMVNGGVKTYYHTNNLYSVAALTNAAGAVVERYTYDPYGKVKILAPDGVTVRTVSAVGNPWYFTGRRLDGESGLMYYRARYYDVGLGRFIGRDRIGYLGSKWNLYSYVRGKPTNFMDPSGLIDIKTCQSMMDRGHDGTRAWDKSKSNKMVVGSRDDQGDLNLTVQQACCNLKEFKEKYPKECPCEKEGFEKTGAHKHWDSNDLKKMGETVKKDADTTGVMKKVAIGTVVVVATGAAFEFIGGELGAVEESASQGKVYRGLAEGEDASSGLSARSPGAGNDAISHVAGKNESQWISTTKDPAVAVSKYGDNGVVEIDLSKVESEVVDLSKGIPGREKTMMSNWSKADQEVLIKDSVPAEAVKPYAPKK